MTELRLLFDFYADCCLVIGVAEMESLKNAAQTICHCTSEQMKEWRQHGT
jgi:hypothetical protein